MNIGIVVRVLQPAGEQLIAIEEARELNRMGHRAVLLFLTRNRTVSYAYEDLLEGLQYRVLFDREEGVSTKLFSWMTRLYLPDRSGSTRLDPRFLIGVAEEVLDEKFDLLLCHDRWGAQAGFVARLRFGVPYDILEHEHLIDFRHLRYVPLLSSILNVIERLAFVKARRVFGTTDGIRESIEERHPELRNKVKTDMIGFRLDPNPNPYSGRVDQVLAVSQWDAWRRPHSYLTLAELLPRYSFVMIGHWRDEAYKKQFLRELSAHGTKNLSLREGLTASELVREYRQSKFVVRFGFREQGLGLSVLQAVESLTPVIMSPDLGVAPLFRAFGGGVTANSVDDAARAIDALDNRGSFERAQDALTKLANAYSWRKHVAAFVET